MSELFSIKKLGILGIIFLLCTATFISGYNINSYAASSSTVLQISRGGTNANTAAQASTNILGSNFANYSGVLPIAKGGTAGQTLLAAQNNLQIPYHYTGSTPCINSEENCSGYIKIADTFVSRYTSYGYASFFTTGDLSLTGYYGGGSVYQTSPSVTYMLNTKARWTDPSPQPLLPSDEELKSMVRIISLKPDCTPVSNAGFVIITQPRTDEYTQVNLKVFLWFHHSTTPVEHVITHAGPNTRGQQYNLDYEFIKTADKPVTNREEDVVVQPVDITCLIPQVSPTPTQSP
ncbi:MAG: hypothetical protein LBT91_03470 [Bifidobacteriaceae bacterium]|jgi:hypothetical protein|nr:hypothetical protein [Bifidobacteriaceae bacterium]